MMTKKFKRELKCLSQEIIFYKIKGKEYKRVKYGEEPNYYRSELGTCECCDTKLGKMHIFGCSEEFSICPSHPGTMIDCPCDEVEQ